MEMLSDTFPNAHPNIWYIPFLKFNTDGCEKNEVSLACIYQGCKGSIERIMGSIGYVTVSGNLNFELVFRSMYWSPRVPVAVDHHAASLLGLQNRM
jgi:hypothetical protein